MDSSSELETKANAPVVAQVRQPQRRRRVLTRQPLWARWLGEPRNAVFLVLATALFVGGGRKLLHAWRARKAVGLLNEENYTEAQIDDVSRYGRAGLIDLFRILGTGETESLRYAAGRAISILWAEDELVKEEEIALVRRGFQVHWKARRRYPRDLASPIPIQVTFGVPFLNEDSGVLPEQLEWSHRIMGARRAGLEAFSPWTPGSSTHEFTIIPSDFETNGPHKLVLQARVRTVGLTDSWELELPHMPFQFEFDPKLAPEALFALPDSARQEALANSVRLVSSKSEETEPGQYLVLSDELALRNPPRITVDLPLPCDLAHEVEVEFENVPGRFAAGSVIVSGDGTTTSSRMFELSALESLPPNAIDRPGSRRLRAYLKANPHLGWAEPSIRSIWPDAIETNWVEVGIVRR